MPAKPTVYVPPGMQWPRFEIVKNVSDSWYIRIKFDKRTHWRRISETCVASSRTCRFRLERFGLVPLEETP